MNGLVSPRTCRRSCADRLVPRRLQAGVNPSGFWRAWFSARQSRHHPFARRAFLLGTDAVLPSCPRRRAFAQS
jgi:hypothetical protein